MRIAGRFIKYLGKMYLGVMPVIAELIANALDADAKKGRVVEDEAQEDVAL
jgi:hypothetical protein